MPPQSRPSSVAPATPRKVNEIKQVLDSLNRNFNVGVEMPGDTMSPADRKARATQDSQYARCVKIYTSLRFLFYHKEGNMLQRALDDFEGEARALSQTWLTSDQLGSRCRPDFPRAETAGQQLSFQNLLLETLDNLMTTTPSVSKFSDRLSAGTTPRKSNSFLNNNSVSFTTSRSALDQSFTANANPTATIHPTTPSSKRVAMMAEDDNTSPTGQRSSPKKHKGRQRPPMDEPVPFKLDTTKHVQSPAGGFRPMQQQNLNPFDAVPARQRVAASEVQDFAAAQIDPLGRNSTAMADTIGNHTRHMHPFDGIRSTETNLRTRDWVANIDLDIILSDSASGLGGRVGYPPSQTSAVSHQFSLPIHNSQPQIPQQVPKSQPVHAVAHVDLTTPDNISEASFHSATNSVAVKMNPVAVSHQAQQPAGFPAPVAILHQTQQLARFPPPVAVSHQTQHLAGIPPPVALGKPITSPLQRQDGFTPPSSSPTTLQDRLDMIWPKLPHWLETAPLAIIWEVTRIGLHCKVDLETLDMQYNPAWVKEGIKSIWADFRKFDEGLKDEDRLFKSFPERPAPDAFETAVNTFATPDSAVVMSANLDWNTTSKGPLLHVSMRPLRLEQACRLTRRFGADRFFEILTPSPAGGGAGTPPCMKEPKNSSLVIDWLVNTKHEFVGRTWQAFYTRDGGVRKPNREYRLEPDAKPIYKERVNFFAESGCTFYNARPASWVPPANEPLNKRFQFKASQMLDWLLCLKDNQDQPYLKLFSRIQLGLSQTTPVLVFEPTEICHRSEDILSPTNKVMNDGIGRMSRGVARKVRDKLGLTDIPSAIQARIGSAKGMWLVDVNDTGDDLWIETYPSQRKWRCDQSDEHQRTLEVRATSTELRSAGLNLQLLPVLEAQASNPDRMKAAISQRLAHDLDEQFKGQQDAFNDPILLRQWIAANFNGRASRVKNGCVSMLGGLPESKEEIVLLLLNSNFVPSQQAYMAKIIWDLQKQKCEQLKTKLNVKVSQSAYVYMVVDFWGVLKEGEVHLGFSNKFQAEGSDESLTLLTNRDVLVTRSPAHFPSDIQKVRAVFKSELACLKDVIVFSALGNVPLADKLSGGDYDGDQAWVCWDQEIVGFFQNAEVPPQPDLSKYMKKDKTTFEDLTRQNRGVSMDLRRELALYDMIGKAFHFAMQQDFLGICTNFKEKACYWRGNVTDDVALTLSTLVGQLVDQSKQGITFDVESWKALRYDLRVKHYDNPRYKADAWRGKGAPQHIIDHLKFNVAIPVIARNLTQLNELIRKSKDANETNANAEGVTYFYDRDLCKLSDHQDELAETSKTYAALLADLNGVLHGLRGRWKAAMAASGPTDYVANVRKLHEEYRAITLHSLIHLTAKPRSVDPKILNFLGNTNPKNDWVADPERWSHWALVKASRLFKLFYRQNGNFIFQMAGEQLTYLKAMATVRPDAGLAPVVVPLMWAGTGYDQRFSKLWTAKTRGDEASEYLGEGAVDRAAPEVFGVWDDGWKEDDDW